MYAATRYVKAAVAVCVDVVCQDGSLSIAECNPEDINSFRAFVWEMKFK